MNQISDLLEYILITPLTQGVADAFYGHRGRKGKRGGSLPRTEHSTKHENSQFETEAGKYGVSMSTIIRDSKEHKYTKKDHKNIQDRDLVMIKGSDIPGSKFKGYQLYRYNKATKKYEPSYKDNPTLLVKDLMGKDVRVFHATSDIKNKESIHLPKKSRVQTAKAEGAYDRIKRLTYSLEEPTEDEELAILTYTGNTYTVLNEYLRKGAVNLDNGELDKSDKKSWSYQKVDTLTKFLGKNKLDADTVVRRTCGKGTIFGQYKTLLEKHGIKKITDSNIEKVLNLITGQEGQDVGFMSTSAGGYEWGHNDFSEEIFAPKGTKAAYISDYSKFQGEKELLFQRGTKFIITGWKKVKKSDGSFKYRLQKQIIN